MDNAEAITVRKYTYRGDFVTSWQGEVVERTPDHVLLRATWSRDPTPVAGLIFEPGDVFLEYYYPRCPYSIWGVHTADGARLKGWYCNICVPLDVTAATFDVRDLLLDVLVYPDGSHVVLDDDEFQAARATDLPADLAEAAVSAVRAVLDLVACDAPPFSARGTDDRAGA